MVGFDCNLDKELSLHKRRQRMRMLWKYYKVGKWHLVEDSVTDDERHVLRTYYGALI
jgi:hypothetical protein